MSPNPNQKMWAGVLLAVLAIGAYIYMKQMNIDEAGLMVFLTPLVTYLLIGAKVDKTTSDQNQQLDKIEKQTNGNLEREYRRGLADGKRQAAAETPSE